MSKRTAGLRAYPFLFAAYPALAMIAANVDQVEIGVVLRPLLVSLLLCAMLYALLALIVRRPESAALLTTWALLLFFTYGHVYMALRGVTLAGESLGRHRYLVLPWLLLLVVGAWWILRRRDWGATARVLTVVSLAAVVFPIVQVAGFLVESNRLAVERDPGAASSSAGLLPEGQVLHAPASSPLPDIYYIILDSYGRSDTLEQYYDYDNSAFIEELERLGFVVAECSQSNYAQTELSIATSTNLAYLEELGDSFHPGNDSRRPLRPLIHSSAVRLALESLGYRSVAFDTGYAFINIEDADRYLSPGPGTGLSSFDLLFLQSTGARLILDSAEVLPDVLAPELNRPEDTVRERILFTFDQLERLAREPGPRYIYAHIVSPHNPYLFDGQGNPVSHKDAGGGVGKVAYAEQARYISQRTLQMIRAVLANSAIPPIILLQSDHGPKGDSDVARMEILNAYLFPGAEAVIDEGITPVNSFRMLFNSVFRTSFTRLPDLSYFSMGSAPYDFTLIPPPCAE